MPDVILFDAEHLLPATLKMITFLLEKGARMQDHWRQPRLQYGGLEIQYSRSLLSKGKVTAANRLYMATKDSYLVCDILPDERFQPRQIQVIIGGEKWAFELSENPPVPGKTLSAEELLLVLPQAFHEIRSVFVSVFVK